MSDFDDFDELHYPRPQDTQFSDIIQRGLSRRGFLKTTTAFGVTAFVTGLGLPAGTAQAASPLLGFEAVAASTADTITLPPGYAFQVVASWGDPILPGGVPFDQKTRGTGESQELAFGDNTDGMTLFPLGEDHGVFVINNEYVNRDLFHPEGVNNADDVRKSKAAHGVSIFEVKRDGDQWNLMIDGKLNRNVHTDTPMEITGPARGHDLMKTVADPSGTSSLGTWNNCGNGETPWGTYLACEENFNGYFASTDESYEPTAMHNRYGVGIKDRGYSWYKHDARFDISKDPNEPNRCGYIVEIDPMDPASTPKKRTALGRFKHENAAVTIADNGHVVVYMGDDERGEYLYKFISANHYQEGNKAANMNLLEEGTLYVARFGEANTYLAGRGEWVELTHGKNGLTADAGFASQAEVSIFARHAATAVNATTMDRPEWVAAHPHKVEVYCTLTNNKNRGNKPNSGGVDTPTNGPNPRDSNLYGQIVRWKPHNEDHSSNTFDWDLFVVAGNPTVHTGLAAGTRNVDADNMFNSPDGLGFDEDGRLWIQTDGNYSNEGEFAGMGNNQMLCADSNTGEIRRFLVGPVSCEITGLAWSPDKQTMFVGVQHPGEKGKSSHFPDGGDSVPRSSLVAITRTGGGAIGS